jgi:hypothetical protein
MMVRSTTEQLLLDCCREFMEGILPAVSDQTAIVRIFMVEQVLKNAAIRAAHEISWITEEIPQIEAYARAVLAVADRAQLRNQLDRLAQTADAGLDLDPLVERYARASEALSTALEIAVTEELTDLRRQGEQLVQARHARETTVMAGWSPTGR